MPDAAFPEPVYKEFSSGSIRKNPRQSRQATVANGQSSRKRPRRTSSSEAGPSHLNDVAEFGSNPGNLRMLTYVPDNLAPSSPLVVVLHGCTQTAAGYDIGAGWSTLADRYGFALLFPEQRQANNQKLCFNWFEAGDIARDRGEPLSIRQMIDPYGARPRHRRAAHIRDRPLCRGRDDGRHAGHLSGGVRGRRRHRRASLRLRDKRQGRLRGDVSKPRPPGAARGATWCAPPPRTAARGRSCRSGTAAPTRQWSPATRTRS